MRLGVGLEDRSLAVRALPRRRSAPIGRNASVTTRRVSAEMNWVYSDLDAVDLARDEPLDQVLR